jgi:hypothetical protein
MRILDGRVEGYLHNLRPARSEVMAEMEAVAGRDSVPIVHWETGRFLATLCRALDPNVLEVGTAIGYSTLHLARVLGPGGRREAHRAHRGGCARDHSQPVRPFRPALRRRRQRPVQRVHRPG